MAIDDADTAFCAGSLHQALARFTERLHGAPPRHGRSEYSRLPQRLEGDNATTRDSPVPCDSGASGGF